MRAKKNGQKLQICQSTVSFDLNTKTECASTNK
jgi:hypothetical protein